MQASAVHILIPWNREDILSAPAALNGRNKYASDHLYQMDIIGTQPGADYYTTDVLQCE